MKFLRGTITTLLCITVLCLAYYKFWFLRQPARSIPHKSELFVSPANGVVVGVKHWNTAELIETKQDDGAIKIWARDVDTAGTIISIQMDVTNVHYQRAMTDGKLISKEHVPGSFNNAVRMNNELGIRFENEHNKMLFESTSGKRYKVVQIAGFLARRIEDYVQPNASVQQGDVIGLIKLGSQVTVILPQGVETKCKVGDVVTDGETVIATQ